MTTIANRTYGDASYVSGGITTTFQVITDEIDDQGLITRDISIFDSSTISVGRRGVLHQFPYYDIPYFEDLGRKARNITVEAIFIGDDHVAQTNSFISVIEQNAYGVLNHPQLDNTLDVVPLDVQLSYRDNNIGITEVRISFIEAGRYSAPSTPVQEDFAGVFTLELFEFSDDNAIAQTLIAERERLTRIRERNPYLDAVTQIPNNTFDLDETLSQERYLRELIDSSSRKILDSNYTNLQAVINDSNSSTDWTDIRSAVLYFYGNIQKTYGVRDIDANLSRNFDTLESLVNKAQPLVPEQVIEINEARDSILKLRRYYENIAANFPASFSTSGNFEPAPVIDNIYGSNIGEVFPFYYNGISPLFTNSINVDNP